MEGPGGEAPGPAWLDEVDEADAALESFMQEDALLDAIQNAPQASAKVEAFEVEAAAPRTAGDAAGAGGAAAPRAGAAGLVRREAPPDGGPKERRHDAAAEARPGAAAPEAAVSRGAAGEAKQHPARPAKSLPWRGALLTATTVLGMVFWGPALWEEEIQSPGKLAAAAYAEPRPIQLPAGGDDDAANFSAVGLRRGSIGVRWSSDSAVNASLLAGGNASALAAAAAAAAAEPPRGDHSRRGRMRGKAGGSELR